MFLRQLAEQIDRIAPALANHLWQSTVFAIVVGLVTLLLRKNYARARYWLWLAASLKFLIPFSLLIGLGTYLGQWRTSVGSTSGFQIAVNQISEPFSRAVQPSAGFAASISVASQSNPLVLLLASAWLLGIVAILATWCSRWRKISAAKKESLKLTEGRELDALRHVERIGGIQSPIEILLSSSSTEPGVVGIRRPVLLWPDGISKHLDDEHLEAIVAHEVWHVRYRDNLAAAIHMVVEAVFWFNPIVWWLGARLVEERERACDEAVLRMGNKPHVYAEGILKTCEFCVESSLECVAGVTGSDLRKRIVRIMSSSRVRRVGLVKKVVLVAIGSIILATPVVLGLGKSSFRILGRLQQANGLRVEPFEVASIKPTRPGDDMRHLFMSHGKFSTEAQTTKEVIRFAYDIKSDSQLSGGPGWIDSEKFDIEAKEEAAVAEKLENLPFEEQTSQIRLMVQELLADRFKLRVSHQTKDLPIYALVVAKGGPKLTQTEVTGPEPKKRVVRMMGPGQLAATNLGTDFLAHILSGQPDVGRLVVDQTELKGSYDWTLKWSPDLTGPKAPDGNHANADAPPPDTSGVSIFTALQEQLGLKLEPKKGPVDTIVIDSIEKPSEN
jgi:bla regulator protein BlaR1